MKKKLLNIWYFQNTITGRDASPMRNKRVQFRQR